MLQNFTNARRQKGKRIMTKAAVTTDLKAQITTLEQLLKVESERRKAAEAAAAKAKEDARAERLTAKKIMQATKQEVLKDLQKQQTENNRQAVKLNQTNWSECFDKIAETIGNVLKVNADTKKIKCYFFRTDEDKHARTILYYGINDGLITRRKTTTNNNLDFIEEVTINLDNFYTLAENDSELIGKFNKIYWFLPEEIKSIYKPLARQKRIIERDVNLDLFEDDQADI